MCILIASMLVMQAIISNLTSVSFGNKLNPRIDRYCRGVFVIMAMASFSWMVWSGSVWSLVEFAVLSFVAVNWRWCRGELEELHGAMVRRSEQELLAALE